MTVLDLPDDTAVQAFEGWLAEFSAALTGRQPSQVAAVIAEDGYWKDVLSLTWDFTLFSGASEITEVAASAVESIRPESLRVSADRSDPRVLRRSAKTVVEGFFDYETPVGRGTGFARLLLDTDSPSRSRALFMLTTLQELHGFPEQYGKNRPTGVEYSEHFGGDNWLDKRVKEQAFEDHDPEVLIVGGGQAGLIIAARLRQIGVDSLVVEKQPNVGDCWRKRYHSLTLHNEVWANSMPYIPFPPTWPTFLPKDKLAGWMEFYAEAMELNVWTSTEFLGSTYDETNQIWSARVNSAGEEKTLRVKHVIMATGIASGLPNVPDIAGIEQFSGEVLHSSQFDDGLQYAGKRAIVFGTGNSGHDVAQDLYSNGAEHVTIVQRSPTCVVSLVPSGTLVYSLYSEGPPNEDIDLITTAIPFPVLKDSYQWLTKTTCELDKDLLDRLRAVGFELDFGEDDTGFHMKYLRRGGGYYINVGCSDLIADGKIGLVQARNIDSFTDEGLRLDDGQMIPADLVVLATGYKNQQEGVAQFFGADVAEKLGPIWGFDDQYFMRNMWKRTPQEGLWIMGGSLIECRQYSRYLALAIKASLEGILTPHR